MLTIDFDLGKVPSVLESFRSSRLTQKAANAAAESYVVDILDLIKSGESFTPRHGGAGLEGAINWHGNGDGSATVFANKEYAPYVEYGTGAHVIRPSSGRKGVKSAVGGQGYILSRTINHPGSKPHPFFFVDMDDRKQHMEERALSVLAAHAANHSG